MYLVLLGLDLSPNIVYLVLDLLLILSELLLIEQVADLTPHVKVLQLEVLSRTLLIRARRPLYLPFSRVFKAFLLLRWSLELID